MRWRRARGYRDCWRSGARGSNEPFRGITTNGDVVPDLYALADEAAPTGAMVEAARHVLNVATDDERARLCHAIDAPQWRMWSNPELYFDRFGLRLDELGATLRDAILAVLQASMSPKGYAKARGAMRTNAFLGELVNAPRVMNQYSYNFSLFGEPSATQPWGWSLFGHHLCLNCFVLDKPDGAVAGLHRRRAQLHRLRSLRGAGAVPG